MKQSLRFLVVVLLICGCNGNNDIPNGVLNRSKMQSVMWDMFLAQSLAQQRASGDSNTTVVVETKKLSQDVFKIHKISEKKFSESYRWYLKHPILLNQILDSIYSQNSRMDEPFPERPQLNESKLRKPAVQ